MISILFVLIVLLYGAPTIKAARKYLQAAIRLLDDRAERNPAPECSTERFPAAAFPVAPCWRAS